MKGINKHIDHTNLKAYASKNDIEKLCEEAKKYNFASVCVNPCWITLAKKLLRETDVHVCTVIGFPLGASTEDVKIYEAEDAIEKGAEEIDVVINIGALKSGDYDYVEREITNIANLGVAEGVITKVIVETCYLTNEEIIKLTKICSKAGVNYIKTSTGFGTGGATLEAVKLMNDNRTGDLKIKASGGIKTYEDAKAFVEAGADRIGTSNGIQIIEGE